MTYDEEAPLPRPLPRQLPLPLLICHMWCTLYVSPSDRFMCWPRSGSGYGSGFVLVITQAANGHRGIGAAGQRVGNHTANRLNRIAAICTSPSAGLAAYLRTALCQP